MDGVETGAFLAAHPGVTVNLATRLKRFNFAAEGFDAAIHFGLDDWRDAGHLKLFDERLTACASPSLLATGPLNSVEDMAGLPLLQIETRPTAWAAWFAAQGADAPPIRGMLFDQFAPMTQAAVAGLGAALLPDYLVEIEIAERRLVPLFKPSIAGVGAYWLVWPNAHANYPPLQTFRQWLASEAALEVNRKYVSK